MADINFYLNSKSSVLLYETLEISHSAFSRTYYIVRNNRLGATLGGQFYEYYPFKFEKATTAANLEQNLRVTLGDLGEILSSELANVAADPHGWQEKPIAIVRTFRSDNPMEEAWSSGQLLIKNCTLTREGSAFDIAPPDVVNRRTGMIYNFADYPGLRGFL